MRKLLLWAGLGILSGLALVPVFRPRETAGKVEEQRYEVERSELMLQEGRLYRTGSSQPFTGLMVEHYPEGSLRSRTAVLEGLLHGLSEGWHTNCQLQVTEHFELGISHGLRTKFYANGRQLSEANIQHGHLEGSFRKWHENGLLAEQVDFVQGQPTGVSLAYFPSGSLKARVRSDAGKVLHQEFWKDGESEGPLFADQ